MNLDAEAQRQQSLLQAKLQEVADETGYASPTVEWVFTNVVSRNETQPPPDGKRRGLSADVLCAKLIRQINDACPGELRVVLELNRIFRSEDIGEIVDGLVKRELLIREADDYFTDFDGLFDVRNLRPYLAQHGIRQRWMAPGAQHRLSLVLVAIGVVVVIAGQAGFLHIPYDWLGWVMILSASLMMLLDKVRKASADQR